MELFYQIQIIPVVSKRSSSGKPKYYIVKIPALNGEDVCTDGKTPAEAVEMAIDYIKCHVGALKELDRPIPVPDMWCEEDAFEN